jgi:hypothetical protein
MKHLFVGFVAFVSALALTATVVTAEPQTAAGFSQEQLLAVPFSEVVVTSDEELAELAAAEYRIEPRDLDPFVYE